MDDAILPLVFSKAVPQIPLQLVLFHVFAGCHAEPQHGIFHPFLLQPFHGQALEQFPLSLEIGLKRGHEQ